MTTTPTPQTKPAAAVPTAATTTKPAAALSEFDRLLSKDTKTRTEYTAFQSETKVSLSVEIVRKYIAVPAKDRDNGEVLPDDRQCTKFILLCQARRLNPHEGDAFMIPFWNKSSGRHEWSLITAHNAFLKRAEVHPDYNGKESGVIVFDEEAGTIEELQGDFVPPDRTLLGGWCKVHYKNKQHPEYQRLKLETYAKGFGNWTFDAAGMICKCSEAAALRSAFPNTMAGMYLREEMGNGELTETTPQSMARPLFSTPAKPPEMPQDEKVGMQTQTPPKTEAKQPEKPEATTAVGPAVVRSLLRISKITEAELMSFLVDIGLTEPGTANLEEADLQNNSPLPHIAEQWKDMSQRIIEARNPAPE
jgi:phage recombination protein Bet